MFSDDTDVNILREVIRLAEKNLDAQLSIVSALAQRSGALAGVLGAGATALLGGEMLALNALRVELTLIPYLLTLIAPICMFVGCAYCGRAAGTSTFQTAGNFPSAWKDNVSENDLKDALGGELENYEQYIKDNDAIISKHAGYLRTGLYWGFSSPIVLAVVGAAFFYCQRPARCECLTGLIKSI